MLWPLSTLEHLSRDLGNVVDGEALFSQPALPERLKLAQLLGELHRPHDLQRGAQVGGPVPVAEIGDQLIEDRAILIGDREPQGRRAHARHLRDQPSSKLPPRCRSSHASGRLVDLPPPVAADATSTTGSTRLRCRCTIRPGAAGDLTRWY